MSRSLSISKVKGFFLRMLSCGDRSPPPLQIGYPTDFRSEDITIPGLTEAEQTFIREKAVADAKRMFATHPCNEYRIPAPEPATNPLPHHSPPLLHHQSAIDRVRRHARKLSAKMGYHDVEEEEFANRPIVRPGEDDDDELVRMGLGIGVGVTKRQPFANQSRDSVTLGGSEGSLQHNEKELFEKT